MGGTKYFCFFRVIIICCIIFYIPIDLYSANPVFKSIDNEQGLSHNWVRCIYQDNVGYMWFGTAGALNRYDGISCKVFNIGNRNVNDIVKKNNEEFWVCTDLGVYVFNTITEKLTHLDILKNTSVLCIFQETPNRIWFGANDGYYVYDISKQAVEKFVLNKQDFTNKSNYVNIIYKDSEHNMWFGTKHGLHVIPSKTKEHIQFVKSYTNSISNNEVYSIIEDANKRLWVGTLQGGLDVIASVKNISKQVPFTQIAAESVMDICIDAKQNIWFATGNGLGVFTLKDFEISKSKPTIQYYRNNPNNPQSISENSIFSLYEDANHDIWIGTLGSGVNMLSFRGKQFYTVQVSKGSSNTLISNIVNAIYEDSAYIWIGTEIGLDRYDKKTKQYVHFQHDNKNNSSLKSNAIFVIKKLSDGNLWIGTWSGGINIYNYKTQTFTHLYPNREGTSLNNDNVFAIAEDNQKNVWIGTVGGGLNKYNMQSKQFTYYTHDTTEPHSIQTNFVNTILWTKDNELYLSASYSLEQYDTSIDGFKHYNIPNSYFTNGANNYITTLFEDSKGHIWVGTYDGLFYFDKQAKTFTLAYRTQEEINNTILGIEEDTKNNIWVSTPNGIVQLLHAKLLPKHIEFLRFTKPDGIAGNEGKRRAIYRNKQTNTIYVGSSQGYTYFNPDSIFLNTDIPNVVFRSFQILNKTPNKNKAFFPLDINPNTINTVELSYKNADFYIDFSILNYLNSENNTYKYKLEGYDTEWIDAGYNNYATYTNIPEGTYAFQVLASNNDGIWTKSPKTLTIYIAPPWWKTLAFRALVVLAIICGIYIIIKIRISLLEKQNKMLELKIAERTADLQKSNDILQKQQQEIFNHRNNLEKLVEIRTKELVKALDKAHESDKLKTAFLNNISHEIRTPMNAIMGFASLIKENTATDEEREKYIDIVYKSSHQLLAILTDIINMSRIESQEQYINNKLFNINELLESLNNQFTLEITNANISLQYTCGLSDNEALIYSDETKIFEILSNLISNAIKFTPKGTISFGYTIVNDAIEFFVEDTGIGIAPQDQDIIFERFRQVESNAKSIYGGTGLGLSISKAYVEMLGGTIWLQSEVNKGSRFSFKIPFVTNNESLSAVKQLHREPIRIENKKSILVVEDELFNFELIKEYVSHFDFALSHAECGNDAIEICKNQDFDIILLDIKLPDIDGFEAAKCIQTCKPHIPIIVQTAYSNPENIEMAQRLGIQDVLIKPYSLDDLVSVLQKYMKV